MGVESWLVEVEGWYSTLELRDSRITGESHSGIAQEVNLSPLQCPVLANAG